MDAFDDPLLLSLGVPEPLLPAVRFVRGQDELMRLGHHLPAEATEALLWLAEGIPVDEVREMLEAAATQRREAVDPEDFQQALEHPDSKRRFVTLQSDAQLLGMLNAPLARWRVFLHPTQEKLARRSCNGPARVLGGAGTGKTVVAMHRAAHLARSVFREETDRVLFVTFTANLAGDIDRHLHTLCADEIARIEVVHLHAWAARFMRTQGLAVEVASDDESAGCWQDAIAVSSGGGGFARGFLRQEWREVVQQHGLDTLEDYLKVSRVGRGKTLSRRERAEVWKVFAEYRQMLRARGKMEWCDLVRETRKYLELRGAILPYRAIVVDEAQDLGAEEWRLIRAMVPEGKNDLFLVGDAHQRIYGRKVVLGQVGVDIRGRSHRLRVNYRTTEEIRAWAAAVLAGVEVDDLDAGRDSLAGYRSLLSGEPPEVRVLATLAEEQGLIVERLRGLLRERRAEEICLVARTSWILERDYEPALRGAGIAHVTLGQGAETAADAVRLATMHRVKGLEFPCMILAGINEGAVPLRMVDEPDDPTSRQAREDQERSLLFVVATRARDYLLVTASGTPSPWL